MLRESGDHAVGRPKVEFSRVCHTADAVVAVISAAEVPGRGCGGHGATPSRPTSPSGSGAHCRSTLPFCAQDGAQPQLQVGRM